MFALFALLSFLLSLFLTYRLSRPDSLLYALDIPNPRSLHQNPTPLSGGLAILAAVLLSLSATCLWFAVTPPDKLFWLGGGVFLLGLVTFIDDRLPLPVLVRLAVQALAAFLLLIPAELLPESLSLPAFEWHWPMFAGFSLLFLFVLWMTNLYNFMDGMDGFAGGMAVAGFGVYAIFGWLGGDFVFAVLNMLIAAAALGFVVWNFPPARIFMGDTGSTTLGFSAAGMALWGEQTGIFPLWIALLVFSPFIADATLTLLWRLKHGEKIWQAHRKHCYQRLVQIGWGHKKTVLWEYALMLACALSALLAWRLDALGQMVILGIWALLYAVLWYLIRNRLSPKPSRPGQNP